MGASALLSLQRQDPQPGDMKGREDSGCDKKDDDITEEVMLAKTLTSKELLQTFHEVESTK